MDTEGEARPRPPGPEPSATLMLLRDAADGLEVFMVERHRAVDFVPGAMVFPGGKVDAADRDPALRARCRTAAGLAAADLALCIAAIREGFEECRVLLARPAGEARLVTADRLRAIEARHRAPLCAGRIGIGEVAAAEDLELACDLCVPFAHWITPEGSPRRYDTHFFLAAAPPDQQPAHDGVEAVASAWVSPARALADAAAGRLTIIFPTLLNLRKLGHSANVAAALERARREPIVTVLPRVAQGPAGPVLRIPAEAGYGFAEAPLDEVTRAFRGGRD
jgi:8-oxo-dGTP pyrophosphatase MutT (NUDIX family)